MCELYEDWNSETMEEAEAREAKRVADGEDRVVKFSKCENHFYHKVCTRGMTESFVKCGVCLMTYGT